MPLQPDVVWKVGGFPAAVIDAKYKAEKPADYPNADPYQLPLLHHPRPARQAPVYARGNASAARHIVRQSGIEGICHAIGLSLASHQGS